MRLPKKRLLTYKISMWEMDKSTESYFMTRNSSLVKTAPHQAGKTRLLGETGDR